MKACLQQQCSFVGLSFCGINLILMYRKCTWNEPVFCSREESTYYLTVLLTGNLAQVLGFNKEM